MTISSQDDLATDRKVQRLGREATTVVNNVHRVQVNPKRPTPITWGDDIVQTGWKHAAVLKLLFTKMEKTSRGCWEWTGGKTNGYGSFKIPGVCGGRKILAHRASWVIFNGKPIPDGLFGCHHCDNPMCFNPDHIFLGTAADNAQDCVIKGRNRVEREGIKTGESHYNLKYDDNVVQEIVSLLEKGKTGKEIKAETGMSTTHISRIRRGYTRVTTDSKEEGWTHHRRVYLDETLESVARMIVSGKLTSPEIAKTCAVSVHLVRDVKRGRTHQKFMERALANA